MLIRVVARPVGHLEECIVCVVEQALKQLYELFLRLLTHGVDDRGQRRRLPSWNLEGDYLSLTQLTAALDPAAVDERSRQAPINQSALSRLIALLENRLT